MMSRFRIAVCVGIGDKSIEEECKPTVKFDTTNSKKDMKKLKYKCTSYLKKISGFRQGGGSKNHSLKSYPSESDSGKRDGTINDRSRIN